MGFRDQGSQNIFDSSRTQKIFVSFHQQGSTCPCHRPITGVKVLSDALPQPPLGVTQPFNSVSWKGLGRRVQQ